MTFGTTLLLLYYIILHRCTATCFNHYVVILRPLKYIKPKITIAKNLARIYFRCMQ